MKKSWKVRLLAILTACTLILGSIPEAVFVYADTVSTEETAAEAVPDPEPAAAEEAPIQAETVQTETAPAEEETSVPEEPAAQTVSEDALSEPSAHYYIS